MNSSDSIDSRVLQGFVPASYPETKRQVLLHGLGALRRIKSTRAWDDWSSTLAAFTQLHEDLLAKLTPEGATAENIKGFRESDHFKRAVTSQWERYESLGQRKGENIDPLSKQERYALRVLMMDPKIVAWRAVQRPDKQRRLNHPNNLITAYKASVRTGRDPEAGPTTGELQMREIGRLDEETTKLAHDRDRWRSEAEWNGPENLQKAEEAIVRHLQNHSAGFQAETLGRVAKRLGFADLLKVVSRR